MTVPDRDVEAVRDRETAAPPEVSVVLPVYRGATTVAAAIESIQAQTLTNWELVVLDDGSDDDSMARCLAAAGDDHHIRIFRHPMNAGLAATMNDLIGLARAPIVAVQEQDDRSRPGRLAVELTALRDHPDVGVVCGIAVWRNDEDDAFYRFPRLLVEGDQFPTDRSATVELLYTMGLKVANTTAMIRRDLLLETPCDEGARSSIDWQLYVDLAHRASILGLHEELVDMRRGGAHQHHSRDLELRYDEAMRCVDVLFRRYGDDPSSPISPRLHRRARSRQLVREAETARGVAALRLAGRALVLDPGSAPARAAVSASLHRVARRARR